MALSGWQRPVRPIRPTLKLLKKLMYVSPLITILSVTVLMWTFRSEQNVQSWLSFYQSISHTSWTTPEKPAANLGLKAGPVCQEANCGQNLSVREVTPEWELSVLPVIGTKTLLISAYLEHRFQIKKVRLIAVVLRSETVAYRCLLCCQAELHVSEGLSSTHSDHFGFPYGTADIMCPIPSACQSPSHITVTSAGEVMPEAADGQCGEKLDQRFMEVKNQKAKTDSFKYNFAVCLSTMFDFTNVLQLVQSLEMMKLLGVDRVVVYKTNCSQETQRLLDHYTQQGFLEVISWPLSRYVNVSRGWLPLHGPGDIHYMGQIPVLNDCIYRYMYQTKYLALQDMDELILPQKVSSWPALLPLLEKKYSAFKCYSFENNIFPITATLPPPSSKTAPPGGLWGGVSGVNILEHLYQEPIIKETHFSNFKIIVSPRAIYSTSVHGVLEPPKSCTWIDRNIARMYHTRGPQQPKLTPQQLIYDGRLLNYSAALVPAVNTALRQSQLLPKDNTHL